MKKIVSFRRMEDGTREDYLLLDQSERDFALGLPDRMLAALGKLDSSLDGYPVTRLEHSLQVATRADAAGADEELVLGALDTRYRRRARAIQPRRSGGRHTPALRAAGSDLDRRAARPVPDLLLRAPSRWRPSHARAPERPSVVRRLRGLLRLGPGLVRPGLRHASARALRTAAASHLLPRGARRPLLGVRAGSARPARATASGRRRRARARSAGAGRSP